ncbi:TetR/AcrR family transcriptional regulator [Nocardioides ferulae]|uniref:TetR/AcrR family transcriptional regulator n=1 Tax=Nocardioides ferulae TaxID=2340821 RepID=UPI000EAFC135|nr:TetR family transcriptional regulator C-terminal domain-containing protein [Nocardioides ferulae]
MPKIVDHDERRREVLDATWRVIGRVGLEATTVRRIAEEAGYSYGVLAHYFKDKDDILVSAHRLAFAQARDRIMAATADRTGVDALRRAMLEALPLDAERFLEAQVDVSFLGRAVASDHLREIRSKSNADARWLWAAFVEQAQEDGEIAPDEDPELVADEVMALIDSVSIQAIIDPERVGPEHQLLLVERLLGRLGARGAGPTG